MTTTIRYMSGHQLRVIRREGAIHPSVEFVGDRCLRAARFKRAFPLSHPDRFISIQDEKDDEVAMLKSLDGMDPDQRDLVLGELDRRYFTPSIERIDDLKQEAGMWRFVVQTQRGATEFYVRNWRDSAFEVSPGRWQIVSVDGLRFEIPKVEDLDGRSQSRLDLLF